MHRTFAILILLVSSLLVGCALPQHNNTLIFSVQRDVGVGVKTPVDGTAPSVYLGYKSLEMAWVPLWANQRNETGRLTTMPCTTETAPEGKCKHGAKFVGDSDSPGKNDAHDAYSTFASFGGDFGAASSKDNGPTVSGKMASFFATGVAAQHLAKAPQMVGLPSSEKDKTKTDEPKKPIELISDFLKTTGATTQTITAVTASGQPTTPTVGKFDYAPACVAKMGEIAGLDAAKKELIKKIADKNINYADFVSDLRAEDKFDSSRENLGMAATLLKQQLSNQFAEKDSKSAARAAVCT